MDNIWEKAISILAGNLNSGLCFLITTVKNKAKTKMPCLMIINDSLLKDYLVMVNLQKENKENQYISFYWHLTTPFQTSRFP